MKDFNAIVKSKVEAARRDLEVDLDPNDPTLAQQLMLGDDWTDPATVTEAVDKHPLYFARWATMLRYLRRELKIAQERLTIFESVKREALFALIVKENIDVGMSPTSAKPSASQVTERFDSVYKNPKSPKYKYYTKYAQPVAELEERIDIVEVIVKAMEHRKEMFLSYMGFIRFQYEQGLITIRQRTKGQQKQTSKRIKTL